MLLARLRLRVRCKQAVYMILMVSLGVIYSWNMCKVNYVCMFVGSVSAGLELAKHGGREIYSNPSTPPMGY